MNTNEPNPNPISEEPKEDQVVRSAWSSLSHVRLSRRAMGGFALGAVSFTASAVAIADYFGGNDAPAERSAKISEVNFITWETLGEFLDRLSSRDNESLQVLAPELGDFAEAQLVLKGVVAQYHIELLGFNDELLELSWSLYDAETRRLLEDPAFRGQPGFPEKFVDALGSNDQRTGELWIPAPLAPGHYYANLEVWDENQNRAHSHISPEFSVKRDGSISL